MRLYERMKGLVSATRRQRSCNGSRLRRELLADLFVTQLETRRVLNADGLAGELVVDAGDAANDGQADSFHIQENDGQVEVSVNGQLTHSARLDSLQSITIQGSSDDDVVTADFGDGALAELQLNVDARGGNDLLRVLGSGSVDQVALSINEVGSGRLQITSANTTATILYSGVEQLDQQLAADALRIEIDNGNADQVTLSAAESSGQSQLHHYNDSGALASGDASFVVNFANPNEHLQVDSASDVDEDADRIDVAGLGASFDAELTLEGDDQDTLQISGVLPLGDSDVTIRGGVIDIDGSIRTNGADVELSATDSVILREQGAIHNDFGSVLISGSQIDLNGSVTAASGYVQLDSGDEGVTIVRGLIDVSSSDQGSSGGEVRVLGMHVGLLDGARVDASGLAGGGTVLVGGDYQGSNPDVRNAQRTYVGPETLIRADAVDAGDGGTIILWAEDWTRYSGTISARGGQQAGDGGFVEVSGKGSFHFAGTVDTSAPVGRVGTLLLDPTNIYIADDQTNATNAGMSGSDTSANTGPTPFQASGASTADSLLLTSTLQTALLSSSVVVTTQNPDRPGGTGNLIVVDSITGPANANSLTLLADDNLDLRAGATIDFSSSSGKVTLTAGSITLDGTLTGGSGGVTLETPNLQVTSNITTNNGLIELKGSTAVDIANVTLDAQGGSILIAGGDIAINSGAVLQSTGASGATVTLRGNDNSDTIGIGSLATAADVDIAESELATISSDFAEIIVGSATQTGSITVNESGGLTGLNTSLHLNAAQGDVTLDSAVTMTGTAGVTITGDGTTTTLNADIVTAGADITINDSVIVGDGLSITLSTGAASAGDISITGTTNGVGNDGGENLTLVSGSGTTTLGMTVGNTAKLGTLTLQADDAGATGTVTFSGAVAADTLTTFGRAYDVQFLGNANITNDTSFLNTGTLTLGSGGDTLTFAGGLNTTGAATNPSSTILDGTIRTDGQQIDLGPVTLAANSSVQTDNNAAAGAALNIGAVTGGGFTLQLDAGTAGAITVSGAVANVSTLTVVDSGGATFQDTVNVSNVVLSDSTGTIAFQGNLSIATSLATAGQGYNVSITGTTNSIAGDTSFLNTGTVTLGDGGDTLTFVGGLNTTGAGTNPSSTILGGVVRTDGQQIDLGTVTLTAGSSVETDNTVAAGAGLNIGAVTGGGFALQLDAGTGGVITASGAVANVSTFTVVDSGGATFQDAVGAGTVVLSNTTGTIAFQGNMSVSTGLTTTGQAYNVSITGATNSIAGDTSFLNTGTLTLGDGGDALAFIGGLNTTGAGTNPSSTTVGGTVSTTNAQIDFGAITLSAGAVIDSGTAATNVAAVTGVGNSLTIIADAIDFTGGAASVAGITTLTLQPSADTVSIGVGNGASGTLNLSDTDMSALADGLGAILIGSATGQHAIDVRGIGFSVNDPLTIRAPQGAGSITVNSKLEGSGNASIGLLGTGATTTLNADIITAGVDITINDSVIVGDGLSITLSTGAASVGDIVITGTTNGVGNDGGENLTLVSGSGTTTLSGAVGDTDRLGTLTLQADDAGATGMVTFSAAVTVDSLTTFGRPYDLRFHGDADITNDTSFLNTGTLTLGNGSDTLTFVGGLNTTGAATNPSSTILGGTIRTDGQQIDLGAVTLAAASSVETDNNAAAGAALNIGAVTGAGFALQLDGGTAGVVTASGAVANVSTLTVVDSGMTTFQDTVNVSNVVLSDTTGTISFQANLTIGTALTTAGQAYNVSITGATNSIAGDTSFLNTGTVTLGDGGDTLTFIGGLNTTGAATNPSSTIVAGTVRTDGQQIDLGPVTLAANSSVQTDNNTPAGAALNIGAITGAGFALQLDGGTGGAITASGAAAGISTLTIVDSGGATFQNTVNVDTVVLSDTTGTIDFQGNLTIATALTTVGQGYNVSITGATNSIAGDTSFLNTGTVTLGDGGDTLTFVGGLNTTGAATNPSSTILGGTIRTDGQQIDLGSVTLAANSSVETDNNAAAGAALNIGAITGAGFALQLDGGTAGVITAGGAAAGISTLTIVDSGGTTFQNTINASNVVLSGTTGTVAFQDNLTIGTGLTTAGQGYNVSITGASNSIAGDTSFLNTGSVTLGDGGDTLTFVGGLNTTGAATNPSSTVLAGTIRTDGQQIDLGAVTLAANSSVETDNNAAAGAALNIGAIAGAGFALQLDGGTGGAITAGGAAANISTLTIVDSGATTFQDTVGAGTVVLSDSTGTIAFQGNLTITTVLTTAAQSYNVSITGATNSIAGDTSFLNTGTVTLGDAAGDSLAFIGGINTTGAATNPSSTVVAGTVSTTNAQIDLGATTLAANSIFNSGTAATNVAAVTGAGNSLTIIADAIDFTGGATTIAGLTTLTLQPSSDTTSIGVGNGASGTLNLSDADMSALADGLGAILIGSSTGQHAIDVRGAGFTVLDPLTIRAPQGAGAIAINSQLTGADNASITIDGPGATTTLSADIVTAGTDITISDSVIIDDGLSITLSTGAASGGNISITGTTDGVGNDGGENLTLVSGSGTTTLTGAVGGTARLGTLTLQADDAGATGTVTFSGAVTVDTLITFGRPYDVQFDGDADITNDTSFLNTGTVTLGNGGDTLTFVGGLNTTGAATNPSSTILGGTIRTDGQQIDLGPVTLAADSSVETDNNAAAGAALNIGAVTGAGFALQLDAGTAGVMTASGAVASVSTLTVVDSGGTTFQDTVDVSNVVLSDTTGTIAFQGNLTIGTALTTTAQGYNVSITGATNSIAGDTSFLNTGTVTLGDGGDTVTFVGGLNTTGAGTNPSSTILGGTIRTDGQQIDLGSVTLAADSSVETDNGAPAGAALNIGAITGAGFALQLDGGTGGVITATGAAAGISTLTIVDSGGTAFQDTVNVDTVVLSDTTGTIAFQGNLTIGTALTTVGQAYNVSITGATNSIAGDTSFLNTGTVTLGDGGDTLTFVGGLNTTGAATNPSSTILGGTIRTDGQQIDLGAVTLAADSNVETDNNAAAGAALNIGAVTGAGFALQLDAGTAGIITASGAAAGISTLTIVDSGGATFQNTVDASDVVLSDTTGTIAFQGNLTIGTGLTTAAQGYNVSITGSSNSIAGDTSFLNTGTVTLGDGGDTLTFVGGLNTTGAATNPSSVILGGTIRTDGQQIDLGAVTLAADSRVETDNNAAAGAALNIGAITGAGFALQLDGGTGGVITASGAAANVSTLTIVDSGATTFQNTVDAGTVVLSDTTGTIAFQGNLTISTGLTTTGQGYNVSITGTTNSIAGDTSFLNTGTVTLGDGGDTLTFVGGLNTTGAATNPSSTVLAGTVRTDGQQIDLGSVTLATDSSLATDNNAAAGAALNIGAITGAGFALQLDAGTTGAITASGAVANVSILTVVDSGSATFQDTVDASNVFLSDTTGTIAFQANLTVGTALTTTAQGYNVSITGAVNNIAGDTSFLNTGTVTLGNAASDMLTFVGGLNTTGAATNPTGTNIGGMVSTTNAQIDLGPTTLTADSVLNSGTAATNVGAVTGAGNSLTIIADEIDFTGGAATVAGINTLTLQPSSDTVSIGVGSLASGTLNLSDVDMSALANGLGSILIGSATGQHAIDVQGGGFVVLDPITIRASVAPGAITVNSDLTGTDNASITLDASTVTLNANIRTDGANITISDSVIIGDGLTAILNTGNAAAGNISITGSVDGVGNDGGENLTLISGSGTTTLSGSVGATARLGTLTLQADVATATGTVAFAGAVTADTVTTFGQPYQVQFNGDATITNDTSFLNTGVVRLGDGGDTLTFLGGLNTTGAATNPVSTSLGGIVRANGQPIDLGPVTLLANSSVETDNTVAAGANLNVGAITGGGFTLGLDAGTAGMITVAGAADNISTLTVVDSAGTTFQNTVGLGTAGAVSLNSSSGTITFLDDTAITALTTSSGAFNVAFTGSSTTVTADASFENTGTVQFGDAATDTLTFAGGLNTVGAATNPSGVTLFGTLRTSGTQMDLGAVTLAGNSVLATDHTAAAGGNLNVGSISGAGFALDLDGGTAGGIVASGAIDNLSTLVLIDSGNTTFQSTVGPATAVTLTATTGTVEFQGNASLASLTTTNDGYGVTFRGAANSIGGATTFLNTGIVTLGDDSADQNTFVGGLVATAPSQVVIAGTLLANDAPITLGTGSLAAASVINAGVSLLTLTGTLTADPHQLTLVADNMAIPGAINSGASDLTLRPAAVGANIHLGSGATDAVGTLGLTDTELNNITTSGTLVIGSTNQTAELRVFGTADLTSGGISGPISLLTGSGTIFVDAALTVSNGLLTLQTNTGAIDFSHAAAITGVTAGGDVTLRTVSAGDITLGRINAPAGQITVDAAGVLNSAGTHMELISSGGSVVNDVFTSPLLDAIRTGPVLDATDRLAEIELTLLETVGNQLVISIDWLEGDASSSDPNRAPITTVTTDASFMDQKYQHFYENPPDPANPAANIPIQISITEFAAGTITLSENGGTPLQSRAEFQTVVDYLVSGTIVPFAFIPEVEPVESLPESVPRVFGLPATQRIFTVTAPQDLINSVGSTSDQFDRYYVLRIVQFTEKGVVELEINEDGKQTQEERLPDLDDPESGDDFELSQLPELFRRLPDDRYRIYLIDGETEQLVLDFIIQQGQPVEVQEDANLQDQSGQSSDAPAAEEGNQTPPAETDNAGVRPATVPLSSHQQDENDPVARLGRTPVVSVGGVVLAAGMPASSRRRRSDAAHRAVAKLRTHRNRFSSLDHQSRARAK